MQILNAVVAAIEHTCKLIMSAGCAGLSADAKERGVILHVYVVGHQEVIAGKGLQNL